eukprot:CAMPEP_0201919648 /NCGR_PEP_ID=MMETSP0903-20130614/8474_1 /ASSEMBLY_ACC=CAM_ASM_000552 /TAXON_ID=420261 /ORGANISM="Thalassiosira antarctica, Strain CCMP982" /LENGTH=288 /DNA_ID=CAMNT_0048456213 /DNA_START=41 /DNA_END=904 /DNA_ORIENTATION=+
MRLVGTFSNLLIVILVITLPTTSLGFSVATSPAARVKDTKVAVTGKATFAIIPPPNALSDNVTLTNYMQLPVEQYSIIPMPMNSSLTRINNDNNDVNLSSTSSDDTEFELIVPPITFFKLALQPVVYASVHPRENRVEITSTKCILRGSPFIEKVNLNERFDFCVNTTLTWEDSLLSQINSAQGSNQNEYFGDVEDDNSMECSITAETHISVDLDVPRPFSSIPKIISERAGNAALKLSLKLIQGTFVDNLAKDYAKWASDLEYRIYRASLSEKEVVKEIDLLVGLGE